MSRSAADTAGNHSLGLVSDYTRAAVARARVVVAEVNERVPFTHGERRTMPVLTIADGIAVAQPGAHTFPIIHTLVDAMVTVDDDAMARAMVLR